MLFTSSGLGILKLDDASTYKSISLFQQLGSMRTETPGSPPGFQYPLSAHDGDLDLQSCVSARRAQRRKREGIPMTGSTESDEQKVREPDRLARCMGSQGE